MSDPLKPRTIRQKRQIEAISLLFSKLAESEARRKVTSTAYRSNLKLIILMSAGYGSWMRGHAVLTPIRVKILLSLSCGLSMSRTVVMAMIGGHGTWGAFNKQVAALERAGLLVRISKPAQRSGRCYDLIYISEEGQLALKKLWAGLRGFERALAKALNKRHVPGSRVK